MSTITADPVAPSALQHRTTRKKLVSNSVFGVAVFVGTEIMFFSALISAFLVIKAGSAVGFSPPEGILLPVAATGLNTAILLVSAVLLQLAANSAKKSTAQGYISQDTKNPGAFKNTLSNFVATLVLGILFVSFQGYEWIQLISYGMDMYSGIFAACFFLIIGCHGLHVLGAVLVMLAMYRNLRQGNLKLESLRGLLVYWYFVVAVWPILYGLVYF